MPRHQRNISKFRGPGFGMNDATCQKIAGDCKRAQALRSHNKPWTLEQPERTDARRLVRIEESE
jgi:hypothetical protein